MTANHRPLEEGDIELIDRVRTSPCLYDTKDPNFRLVHKKEQEWQAVAESLAMSHFEARKRWTVLRDRYARELKQLILHPESKEYGRNDFFLRMDFIRNFVKKREVKRRRCNSQGVEIKEETKPRPIKLYKVDSDANNYESDYNQMSQPEKSYIIDDCQDSSVGKYSYVEQMSQDPIVEQEEQHGSVHHIVEHCGEQEYHDYVEDTSAAYEDVEEDHENITHDNTNNYLLSSPVSNSANLIVKPESSKLVNKFNITTVEEVRLSAMPSLQQRPVVKNPIRETASPSLPPDTEEYFSKTIASYLRQLSPRYKIRAKVEMMQIIEKFIELEENKS